MSTEPEPPSPTENTGPGTPDDAPPAEGSPRTGSVAAPAGDDGTTPGSAAGGITPGSAAAGATVPGSDGATVPESAAEESARKLSEAEAELAAQKLERERIERRKAEKQGPIPAGTKLSGKAADLLAAVRAVESGEKPTDTVFADPEPAPPRAAPEPVRRPQPVAPDPVATAPAPDTVEAVRRVLAGGGAPEALAPQVAAALGEGAAEALGEDPWQLLRVPGVRPEQADGFARALLGAECAPDDERRGRAVTVWLLEQAALAGHTALELPTLT
ncbi:helix-hairpin-helix domain-containing protein, partial [Streptomyces sp. NPDC057052]|uniref:helix-hairpin-helix domain-containing protein n=1 Tax=Streptomyces sp. NPDC057052 TaxID=3346010 RepID=UPI00362C55F8